MAVENLPLTFVFLRPDGVEDRRIVTDGGKLGGYNVDLPLQQTAMRGTWTMNIYTDPKGALHRLPDLPRRRFRRRIASNST